MSEHQYSSTDGGLGLVGRDIATGQREPTMIDRQTKHINNLNDRLIEVCSRFNNYANRLEGPVPSSTPSAPGAEGPDRPPNGHFERIDLEHRRLTASIEALEATASRLERLG